MSNNAYTVSTKTGLSHFSVIQLSSDSIPDGSPLKTPVCRKTIMRGAQAEHPSVIRISGGCSNMTDEFRGNALQLIIEELLDYRGILYSGATREIENGKVKFMITDIPGEVAKRNGYRCIALGTVPKAFEDFLLKEESRLTFDADDKLVPAPGMEWIVIVQESAEICTVSKWSADMVVYAAHIEEWENLGFRAGMIAFNGGEVTWKEIILAAERGWELFLIKGSGRKTDEFIARWCEDESFRSLYPKARVTMVPLEKGALSKALAEKGFILA